MRNTSRHITGLQSNTAMFGKYIRKAMVTSLIVAFLSLVSGQFHAFAIEKDLSAKIGQMLMVGFRGTTVSPDSSIVKDISTLRIGGVILFDYDVPLGSFGRNIVSPSQLSALTGTLQEASSTPLFIAVDQEGGRVSRLKENCGFPPTMSQSELGTMDDPAETGRMADRTARTLVKAGINLNFAPVVDVNINPRNPVIAMLRRSYSSDPHTVIRHARETIKRFHHAGVLSAIKHFPGHGSSAADSHLGFVDVTHTWKKEELTPFAVLIGERLCDMVMTAHIVNRKLDPEYPATLSDDIINGVLRKDLSFDGVVVSDDMQMKAIRGHYSLDEALPLAIKAGVDILLFANNSVYEEDIAARAVKIIRECISRGTITEERINASYERIMKLKQKLP